MNSLTTIRIYFEYGKKQKHVPFWKTLHESDYATIILKKAKAANLNQVLHFNVSKGYFNSKKINWGLGDVQHFKHPQIIEITDTPEQINWFLESEKVFFEDTSIYIIKNEILLKP
ncbi:hypothetical protein FNB79_03235 [Formosa sediminum]|uniref:DUF190 domain-containing protein n=1 Tax=Formosa sediminum TaxID=2594004 RepID=A0A516GND7_9FLAO|nr:hypothetical protein [Formosa sediminum]QDO93027.1 hypothetical protein FNB79_03235 [Formosa sediminum]